MVASIISKSKPILGYRTVTIHRGNGYTQVTYKGENIINVKNILRS